MEKDTEDDRTWTEQQLLLCSECEYDDLMGDGDYFGIVSFLILYGRLQ